MAKQHTEGRPSEHHHGKDAGGMKSGHHTAKLMHHFQSGADQSHMGHQDGSHPHHKGSTPHPSKKKY